MSVSGLCEICQRGEVRHTCDRCGALVCDEHFDAEIGLCVECAAEVRRSRQHRDRDEDGGVDGTDTYRF